jgi:nucleoid-associated protein YgaU
MYDTTRRPERAPTEPVRRGPLTAGELSAPRPGASTPATVPATRVADAAQSAVRTYTVKSGDTLSEISQELYGKSAKWRDIFEANKTKLASPDVLVVGMELVIP